MRGYYSSHRQNRLTLLALFLLLAGCATGGSGGHSLQDADIGSDSSSEDISIDTGGSGRDAVLRDAKADLSRADSKPLDAGPDVQVDDVRERDGGQADARGSDTSVADVSAQDSVGYDAGQVEPHGIALTAVEAESLAVRVSSCLALKPLAEVFGVRLGSPEALEGAATEASVRCILDAPDCPEVLRCVGFDPETPCPEDSTSCPLDDTLRECKYLDNGLVRNQDRLCTETTGGSLCLATGESEHMCGTAGCSPGSMPYCDGEVFVECRDGVLRRVNCPERGLRCYDAPGASGCLASADPCDRDYCQDGRLVFCLFGAAVRSLHCAMADAGLDCVNFGESEGPTCGVPAEQSECAYTDHCDGDTIQICSGGREYSFDCSAFLDGTCVTNEWDEVRCKVASWP